MGPVVVDGMHGLGDTIYQTPIVSHLCSKHERVYMRTAWPQVYPKHDNLFFVQPDTQLRTQSKNVVRSLAQYDTKGVAHAGHLKLSYVKAQAIGTPLYVGLMQSANVNFKYHLALLSPPPLRRKVAVIRPATVRTEWRAVSRNPKQEYIQHSIDTLNALGFETVVLADIVEGREEYAEFRPLRAARYYEKGELPIERMMKLVLNAAIVVGGVGFMAPMCIALGTPTVIIHGGAGGWNGPALIDAPGRGQLTHVLPTRYCRCRQHEHPCDKTIDLHTLTSALKSIANEHP